ncbi:MAG: hypothetical protein KGD68_14820 [Candidatus Lokiarchaeota archaeon]|nr:hypothetical protein [Candidatus Lokiarchaeota archaeon]
MIEAILTFEFVLIQKPTGEVKPDFKPIVFSFENKQFTNGNLSELIATSDLFSILYHHTTSIREITGGFSNYYEGRLKETSFQVSSYFIQAESETQYLTILIFTLDEDLGAYEDIIKSLARKMDYLFETFETAKKTNQISLISKIHNNIETELKYAAFQIKRLTNLDKIQKSALIFNSYERLEILKTLREFPKPKKEVREIVERIRENPNLDVLLEPFLELNLIRRDWIKGKRDKRTGLIQNQGEYLFLTKDIEIIRVPNYELLDHLKESKHELYSKYEAKVVDFFSEYDPKTQTVEEKKKVSSILLNPDIYDLFAMLRNKYYPRDKIPNVFSEFADTELILDELIQNQIVIEIKDQKERPWLLLLTDIQPIIFFPEYLLNNIKDAYHSEDIKKKIPFEVAKKALDLLEVAYPEKIEI